MKYILFILIIFFTGCTLTETSTLIIENNSNYQIEVSLNRGHQKEIVIEKNKGDFVMTDPGEVKLTVFVSEFMYKKDYVVNINYLEKKKFIFTLD